jgi:hypothetical protein
VCPDLAQIILIPLEHGILIVYALHDEWRAIGSFAALYGYGRFGIRFRRLVRRQRSPAAKGGRTLRRTCLLQAQRLFSCGVRRGI